MHSHREKRWEYPKVLKKETVYKTVRSKSFKGYQGFVCGITSDLQDSVGHSAGLSFDGRRRQYDQVFESGHRKDPYQAQAWSTEYKQTFTSKPVPDPWHSIRPHPERAMSRPETATAPKKARPAITPLNIGDVSKYPAAGTPSCSGTTPRESKRLTDQQPVSARYYNDRMDHYLQFTRRDQYLSNRPEHHLLMMRSARSFGESDYAGRGTHVPTSCENSDPSLRTAQQRMPHSARSACTEDSYMSYSGSQREFDTPLTARSSQNKMAVVREEWSRRGVHSARQPQSARREF
eukprot:Rmarinus@m.8180